MKRTIIALPLLAAALGLGFKADAHDVITTNITWSREISRIVFERCASCHREKGAAFSLMTYAEARPWAVAIKGYGEFRNDQGLTSEQLELFVSWVEGGVPEGNPKDLKPAPKPKAPAAVTPAKGSIVITGDFKLPRPFTLDGLLIQKAPNDDSFQLMAEFPDGATEPLLWMYEYKPAYKHPFLFRRPIKLTSGTVIRGAPAGSSIALLTAGKNSR